VTIVWRDKRSQQQHSRSGSWHYGVIDVE
jgi:hypothetical protein